MNFLRINVDRAQRFLKAGLVVGGTMSILSAAPIAAGDLHFSAEIASETRIFHRSPLYPRQSSATLSPSLTVTPEFRYNWRDGTWEFLAKGFFRFDSHDRNRTHVDARELGLQYVGRGITAFVGMGKAFWGVTEARHLVDIVNQEDGVEGLDGEEKLGQPMVSVTFEGKWGALDVSYLFYFRERTFQAEDARLRGPLPVSSEAEYESGLKKRRPSVAIRWFRNFDSLDVGVSMFHGTSREPRLVPSGDALGDLLLNPFYDIIDQVGLDLQWTGEKTLLKFEGITRGGHGSRINAATAGVEHTLFQVLDSNSDLGLLAEIMLDSRGHGAPPTNFDNDLFLGVRWALNDHEDTSLLGGPVIDLATGEFLVIAEAERRIGMLWSVSIDAQIFGTTRSGSLAHSLRRDGFVSAKVSRFI